MKKNFYGIIIQLYLVVFACLMIWVHIANEPDVWGRGEWDDYTLPVASILNDQNFTINASDIAYYKELFTNWREYIDYYELSGYVAKNGSGELTWYFPVYSIFCLPFVIILKLVHVYPENAFWIANLCALLFALCYTCKVLKCDAKLKFWLMVLLSANPIVFYLGWCSAEVLIYAALLVGLVSWYNKWYKRAAFFVSLAGMLNPTIMVIGIVMIADWFLQLYRDNKKSSIFRLLLKNWRKIIGYGACYIIGIVPMLYNYYNIGHINLTASYAGFAHGRESIFARFLAYLFDLNLGIFPYYPIVLLFAIYMIFVAVKSKHARYCLWILVFILNVCLYSVMSHINCGMAGIARYNAWGVLPLLLATLLYGYELCNSEKRKILFRGALGISSVITIMTIVIFNPFMASDIHTYKFVPLAKVILKYCPEFYNPMYSTFCNRTLVKDGGYSFEKDAPIVYYADDGYVRKILASKKNAQELMSKYYSYAGETEWVAQQINQLGEDLSYISIPGEYKITAIERYELGEVIDFSRKSRNVNKYVFCGLHYPLQSWGTWMVGKNMIARMFVNSDEPLLRVEMICGLFSDDKRLNINFYCNDKLVHNVSDYSGGEIDFVMDNPGKDVPVELRIEIPEASSVTFTGEENARNMNLGIQYMRIITEE